MHDYYQLLGIEVNADIASIKKAYRKKAFEFHPDVNKSPQASTRFIKITEAYEYLINNKNKYFGNASVKNPFAEQMREYQNKAQKMAEMDFETFKRECEAFQNSPYYYVGVMAMYLAGVIYLLISAALICMPIIVAVKAHTLWYAFALIPLALAGVYLFWNAFREQSFWSQYLRN